MKKLTQLLLAVPLFVALSGNAAIITVGEGETGEGSPLYGNIDGVPLTWTWGFETTLPHITEGLIYTLPGVYGGAFPGFVLMADPGETPLYQDVLHFDGQGHLTFYSRGDLPFTQIQNGADAEPGLFDQLVATVLGGTLGQFDVITELTSLNDTFAWAPYTASAGRPGFVFGATAPVNPDYIFISDVPEPSSVVLSLVVLAGAAGYGVRRHRRNRTA